uniref:Sec-Y independent protein translocase component n=1 Tax=Nothoceros aenigmaticus TaxID=13813 RepID=C3RYL7_9EMBR|nr:Sec-Y independent protein translocase component [Nothoceros aenigmaticus]ACC86774.1 Sec-Y independent protein translocase component [Nothoceros aenigmaticus]
MNFVFKTISEEVRIRFFRILIRFSLTRFTCHWFPEECIFLLAKSSPTSPYLDSFLIRTESTEASSTYVTTSLISRFYFFLPLPSHQIWCFFIPSCYEERRREYKKLFYLSGFRFFLFLFVTFVWVVPKVRHFLYESSTTSTNSLIIKLQPKILDYTMPTVRISFISPIRSQVPVLVICLLESKDVSVKTCIKNRRFSLVLPVFTAALITPPEIWCQIVACLPIYFITELTILYALIIQVHKKLLSG